MAELLKPIGELSSAMAQMEVPDAAAEATLAEVLAGTSAVEVGRGTQICARRLGAMAGSRTGGELGAGG